MKTILIMGTFCLIGILVSCGEQTKTGASFNFYGLERTFAMMRAGFADGENFIVQLDTPSLNEDEATIKKAVPVEQVVDADRSPPHTGPGSGVMGDPDYLERERKMLENPPIQERLELDLPELFEEIEVPLESKRIDNEKDTVIAFSKGTRIHIPSRAFVSESGKPLSSSMIDIRVGEYYQVSDLLASNLTTQTSDRILETGGTVFIEARSGGQKCKIKEGVKIDITFPTKDSVSGMQLFTGKRINDRMVWEADVNDSSDETISAWPDVEAQFPGGAAEMMRFVNQNFDYPNQAIENNEQGRVFLSFIVQADGEITNIKVERSVSESLDKEAVWVVERMPDWVPAELSGNPVPSRVQIPISCTLIGGDERNTGSEGLVPVPAPVSASTYNEEFKESFEKRMSAGGDKRVSMEDMSNYVLSTSELGWINCDRFYTDPREKVDFVVQSSGGQKENVKIVFKNEHVVMQGVQSGNGDHHFDKIPFGAEVSVIGFKVVDGEYYLAMSQLPVGYNRSTNLNYRKCTLLELQSAMAKLNW